MQTDTHLFDNVSTKVIACAVIVGCLLLGLAGLVLPLIPGLLFLAVAAIVAAKLSPKFAETLRQNDTLRSYLEKSDRMAGLSPGQQAKVVGLLLLKALIEGVEWLVKGVMKVLRTAERV
jgi:uncharacterized membrane protein YbaN (DUF454 family)